MQQDILDYPQPLHGEVEKKKNMKTEIVLAAVFVVGFLFKVSHWPLAGFLLFISLAPLSIIYFFLSFYFFSYNNIKTQNIPLSVAGGIFLSFVPLAMLCTFQHWPGRGFFTLVGGVASPVVLAVVYSMRRQSPSHLRYYYNNMLIRSAILAVIGLIMFLQWLLLWF